MRKERDESSERSTWIAYIFLFMCFRVSFFPVPHLRLLLLLKSHFFHDCTQSLIYVYSLVVFCGMQMRAVSPPTSCIGAAAIFFHYLRQLRNSLHHSSLTLLRPRCYPLLPFYYFPQSNVRVLIQNLVKNKHFIQMSTPPPPLSHIHFPYSRDTYLYITPFSLFVNVCFR